MKRPGLVGILLGTTLAACCSNKDEITNYASLVTASQGKILEAPIHHALESAPARAYLLDFSRSMANIPEGGSLSKAELVKSFAYPTDSDVYAFSSCNIPEGMRIQELKPGCDTPMWDGLFEVIQKGNYASITVLTDGIDNDSCKNNIEVEQLARQRGIPVSIIGVGVPKSYAETLQDFATNTGGTFTYLEH